MPRGPELTPPIDVDPDALRAAIKTGGRGGARSVKKQLGLTCKANNIDQKDKTGWTGLMKAASQGDLEIVALMIGAGADVRMVCSE